MMPGKLDQPNVLITGAPGFIGKHLCKFSSHKGFNIVAFVRRSVWALIDPTHQHFFSVDSFAYYDPSHIICQRYDYVNTRFSVEKVVFNETLVNRWFKKLIIKIANRWPNRYESYLSHLVPLDDITYYLRRI